MSEQEKHLSLARGERLFFEQNIKMVELNNERFDMIAIDQTKPHYYPHVYPSPHVSNSHSKTELIALTNCPIIHSLCFAKDWK